MRTRWLAAIGVGLLAMRSLGAQPPSPASLSVFETPVVAPESAPNDCRPVAADGQVGNCDRPTTLPPLLPVPPTAQAPRPATPAGPKGEYDHGHLYLPERAPEMGAVSDPPCGPDGRFWLSPTLELGWTKANHVPALLRVGSPSGPVAFGDSSVSTPFRAGLGLAAGMWLDQRHVHGIDASFYYLAQGGSNTTLLSGQPAFFLPTAGGGAFPLADPAAGSAGAYQVGMNTRFASADVNYRHNLLCGPNGRLDGLVGYRYGHVGEDFTAYGKRLGPDGEIVRFRDDATAVNHFHGGQIGLAGEYRVDRWFVTANGKVAFGAVLTDTDLEGKFRVNGTVVPSGFYARPGLNGTREYTRFGVMPTVGFTFGRQLGDHARVFIGYNFLYLNNLTRAGDIVDPTPSVLASNPQATVPLAAPNRRDATTSDIWAQSVSAGLEWRY